MDNKIKDSSTQKTTNESENKSFTLKRKKRKVAALKGW